MAGKQAKKKSQAKSKARGKKVKMSDLSVPKGGSVKGGAFNIKTQITTWK